jgi:5-(carboxyamino)imidazole ribonucleotide synthase
MSDENLMSNDSSSRPLEKGDLIGLLGGGQLGMYFTQSAQKLGYRVCCYCQSPQEPAVRFADESVIAPFDDVDAIQKFVNLCDVVTYEFESIPPGTLEAISNSCLLRPSLEIIHTTQNRAKEKTFLRSNQIPTANFAIVNSLADLQSAVAELAGDSVLKTASGGYDGKGQWSLTSESDLAAIWEATKGRSCTLESRIDLAFECSMIVAGDIAGNRTVIGPIQNFHRNHILDLSYVDHDIDPIAVETATVISKQVADHFGLVGTICIEFFVSKTGDVLVNEIAPRPHNSGHLTIDAFSKSQFDLQAQAVAGLEVDPTTEIRPAAMVNLLGDLWANRDPNFELAEQAIKRSTSSVHVRLYGKPVARPGRKMGHVTVVGDDQQQAIKDAVLYRAQLESSTGEAIEVSVQYPPQANVGSKN